MGHLTCKLYDLQSNELADISGIALERSEKVLLDGPRMFTIKSIGGHSLLTTVQEGGDGYPNLWAGNRKLVVWEDGIDDPIFHGRVFGVKRSGTGGKKTPVVITAYDPSMELGYEGDERAGRVVRGSTAVPTAGDPYGSYDGNFINPKFASSVGAQDGISGPDLILQALRNSQQTGTESDPTPGEGPLPIDIVSGDFDLDVPPAVDLSCLDSLDWPVMCGDWVQKLVSSGVCDFNLRPLEPGTGKNIDGDTDPYVMVELSAVSRFGTDKSGTVHFDYATGARNAATCDHVQDFSTICNKLYDYLGPRRDNTHWAGNITPGSPGTTVDPSDSRTLYGGQFLWFRVFDSIGDENSNRPLYIALWNAEAGFRVFPRDMLLVTPVKDHYALFDALKDYGEGDDVAVNVGATFGIELAESQRVYGFTKTWSRQGVSSVSEILTSAQHSYG